MARNTLTYLEILLDQEWEKMIDGREKEVPKPDIYIAGDTDHKRIDLSQGDSVIITNGGPDSLNAKGITYGEKERTIVHSIDIRTTESRERLEGWVDPETREPERYGGLAGEIERIVDSVRRGEREFDWIEGYEFRDLSEDVGFSNWRGVWEVRLKDIATPIDTEP